MDLKSIAKNAKMQLQFIALVKNPKFAFYRILGLLNRKLRILPDSVFRYDMTSLYGENYLEPYVHPRHGGAFIDVGANVGYWTMLARARGFNVYAYEPSPRPFQILKNRTNKIEGITVHRIALGDKNHIAKMKVAKASIPGAMMGFLTDVPMWVEKGGFIGEINVKVRTLDSFNLENVEIIKIDTEGFEIPVLKGSIDTINRCKPILISEAHPPFREEIRKILNFYKNIGYHWEIKSKKDFWGGIPNPHIIGFPPRDVITEQYWKRNDDAYKLIQGIKLHNYRFNSVDFIANEMKKGKTLDVGCGSRGMGSIANIDIVHPSIIPDNFQIMDGHDLHFPNNSFEAVSIVEVIEHVENPSQVLREIYRVLKKDGTMYLTTPNPSHISIFLKYLRNKRVRIHCDHIHTWNWEMLAWLIHTIGFRNIEVFLWGFIDEMIREGKPVKLYRSYRLANLLYRLGIRNTMLHLNIFIKCRK